MVLQSDMIHNVDWDIVFVIDACRYDVFRDTYKEIFGDTGTLKKVTVPSTWTVGWLIETFDKQPLLDTYFVSGNFVINSKGSAINKIHDRKKRKEYGDVNIDCRRFFKKIIDVWDFGFEKEIGMSHPKTICDEMMKILEENSDNKIMAKFWQIHDPYLYFRSKKTYQKEDYVREDKWEKQYKFASLLSLLNKFVSNLTIWRIKKLLGIKPVTGLYYVWYEHGKEGIIKGYKEDLKLTLNCIKEVIDRYPEKKFVITSDHGELLGEGGNFGHSKNEHKEEITSVPWYQNW